VARPPLAFDEYNAAAVVPNREATRLISCSQEGSGAFVARLPDLTVSSSIIGSDAFLVILQRRLGLYLTALAPILNAAAADGQVITEYERLGDADINASNNTARHNAALHAAYHALKSVIPPGATPPSYALCDRGDGSPASKEDAKRRWKWVNATHIPDIARVSAPPFGYELKAYTPFNQKVALGHGSNAKGGAPSTAEGHIYAFGCTEENIRKLVYGLKQIGDPSDEKYDRSTGKGRVDKVDGQYADALQRGIGVALLLVETTGALSAGFMTILRILAKQARLPGATDLTQYGEGRASPKAFLTHHVANISTAVQAADAHTVLNAATSRAQRLSHGFA